MTTELDFNQLRDSLRDFLRSQDTLQDYDFEGSAITSVIDLLAYTTHFNAINANLGLNETFLDTAQFRGSVVGHAKQLSYVPTSASGAIAVVDITVNNPNSQELTLERGHPFRATSSDETYTFVPIIPYTTENATFKNVRLVQGRIKTAEFVFDVRSGEKFIIPDEDIDTSTILVTVFDSRNSSNSRTFTEAKALTSIQSDSNVYFLSENYDGLFEIEFGDDIIGKALDNGNLVRIEYLVSEKAEANGASTFSTNTGIGGNTNISITTIQRARGGDERESIESVRRNAPLTFASQNRAVVPNDFEAVIRENFANVSSVKVWGGEDNDPPVYGKVFISVLPKVGDILTIDEQDRLLNEVIVPKSVLTVTPELLDPEFLVITSEVFFKYDPSLTNLSEQQLENKVVDAINDFDENKLEKFDNVFRYSQFLQTIDDADDAILNSFARIYLSKRFVPALSVARTYTLNFSTELYESFGTRPVIFDSSTFTIDGTSNCRFKDFLNEDGTRRISVVRGTGIDERVVIRDAGRIEGSLIILDSFAPESIDGEVINIEAVPSSYDIAGTLNTVLTLDCDCSRFNVQGEVDTIVSGRDYSGVNYRTFNRDSGGTVPNSTNTMTTPTTTTNTNTTVTTTTTPDNNTDSETSGSTGGSTGGSTYGY